VHANLAFGGGGARRRVNESATMLDRRLLSLAAKGRCRPWAELRELSARRPEHPRRRTRVAGGAAAEELTAEL